MKHLVVLLFIALSATLLMQGMHMHGGITKYLSEELQQSRTRSTSSLIEEDPASDMHLITLDTLACETARKTITLNLKMWQTAARQAQITTGLAAALLPLTADENFFTDVHAIKKTNELMLHVLTNNQITDTNAQLKALQIKNSLSFYITTKLVLYGWLSEKYQFTFPADADSDKDLIRVKTAAMQFYAKYLTANKQLDPERAKYPFIAHLFATNILFHTRPTNDLSESTTV